MAAMQRLPARPSRQTWRSRIGEQSSDPAYLAAISPARHAANVKAPVLLIHCEQDLTVPIGQSVLEQSALQAAHKDVQFVRIDGDDHYLMQQATRVRLLQEIEKFLKAHIG